MTVICPSCDARFRDPPAEIMRTRPLQCSKCEHEWFVDEVVVVDTDPVAQTASDAPQSPMDALLDNEEGAIRTGLPVVVEQQDAETEERKPLFVDREPAVAERKSHFALMSCAAILMLGTITGLIAMRDTVMKHVPETTAAYSAAGLVSQTRGLEIANVVTTRSKTDGIRKLIVRGEIENLADNTVPVPPIKLIMRNKNDAHLYAWTVSASKPSLNAGERGRFTAVAQDYPDEAVNVEVEFAPLAKGKK